MDINYGFMMICITYLSFDVFGYGFCESDDEFQDRLKAYPLYNYAACQWGDHAQVAPAAQSRHYGEVMDFLKSHAKVEAASQALLVATDGLQPSDVPRGLTGLYSAAILGLPKLIAQFYKFRRDKDPMDAHNQTPLPYAAKRGHEAAVEILLKRGADMEAKEKYLGQMSLLLTAENGHEAIVRLLLNHGANYDVRGGCPSQRSLSWAVENGHTAIVRLLLENGANTETRGEYFYRTPLGMAAKNGHESIVKLLLESGANTQEKCRFSGRTPFVEAAENGHEAVMRLLLEKEPGIGH